MTVFVLGGLIVAGAATMMVRQNAQSERASEAKDAVFGDMDQGIDAAMLEAEASGKAVYVLATADWCGPCQSFKGSTLADESVVSQLKDRTVPYYLDVTSSESMSDEDKQLATDLKVTSIPAMYVIRDGNVTGKLTGNVAADKFIAWLEDASAPPAGAD